jgi:hypothetical protein
MYGCGSGATLCEIRLSSAGSQSFTISFGSGNFADHTQPTGISDLNGNAGRWVFAVVTKSGKNYVYARRDMAPSFVTPPQYSEVFTLASANVGSGRYSSVLPYINKDGKLAVVYFATVIGSGTTKVRERVFDVTSWSWSASTDIHDVGRELPQDMEPVPSVTYPQVPDPVTLGRGRGSVVFRMPDATAAGTYKDTFELRQQNNGRYVKASIPAANDDSNLFIFHGNKLYRTNEDSGSRWEPGTTWSSVTAFASDRIGLGYAVLGSALWEINLQDSTRRQLSTGWPGTKDLTFGYEYPSGEPKLWAIQNGVLYKVDLSNGTKQSLTQCAPGWGTNTTSMAYMNLTEEGFGAWNLFIISNGALWIVDSNGGNCGQTSASGDWTGETNMTTDQYNKLLYVVGGPSNRLRKVNHLGTVVAWSTAERWANSTSISYLQDYIYVVRGSQLHKVSPDALSTLNPLGSSNWSGQTYMAPRAWYMNANYCDVKPGWGCVN